MTNKLPTYPTLFGPTDFEIAEEGRSIYSPAAYLADLLQLVDDSFEATSIDLDERRPDIRHSLQLDGDNTFTVVPYLDIVNRVLRDSDQVHCATMVSERSDQSAMLHQLPPLPGRDDYDFSIEAVRDRRDRIGDDVRAVFARGLLDGDEIREAFAAIGWRCISDRTIQLRCSCSRARMVDNVRLVYAREGDALFDPGQNVLEIVCEYCKSKYLIARKELRGGSADPN